MRRAAKTKQVIWAISAFLMISPFFCSALLVDGWPDFVSCTDADGDHYLVLAYDDGGAIMYNATNWDDSISQEWFDYGTRLNESSSCGLEGESIDDTNYFRTYNIPTSTTTTATTTMATTTYPGYFPTFEDAGTTTPVYNNTISAGDALIVMLLLLIFLFVVSDMALKISFPGKRV